MFNRHKKQALGKRAKPLRIGIYSGTFNPVHAGHIAFALQSIEAAGLDRLYFLPERRPRHKKNVEHFGHRVAMLRQAVQPHPKLGVLEYDDVSFTVQRTLPRVLQQFRGHQLVFLMGSDVAAHAVEWPLVDRLFTRAEIVIGLREGADKQQLMQITAQWTPQPKTYLITSQAPTVSSHKVREALGKRVHTSGLLHSVARYSNRHWLYVSLAEIALDKA